MKKRLKIYNEGEGMRGHSRFFTIETIYKDRDGKEQRQESEPVKLSSLSEDVQKLANMFIDLETILLPKVEQKLKNGEI